METLLEPKDSFLSSIHAEIQKKKVLLDHPLSRLVLKGELTLWQLREWTKQRFIAIHKDGVSFFGAMLARAGDWEMREHLLETIAEEMGLKAGEKAHRDLLIHFGEALGLSRQEMLSAELFPESQAFADSMGFIAYTRSAVETLSAIAAIECQNPEALPIWADALHKHYHVPFEALSFFTVHATMDIEHSQKAWNLASRYAQTPESQAGVVDAVRRSLNGFWLLFDGVYRRCVLDR
jgi:pyrroloquinoline quinone (PQQ) biosynthesis protein C